MIHLLRGGGRFCAIQCKFYNPESTIKKTDIDSFIAAGSADEFSKLLLIDTSNQELATNAVSATKNNNKFSRLDKIELYNCKLNWLKLIKTNKVSFYPKKKLLEHQIEAYDSVCDGLNNNDRGKLILPCGTGKTFISLKVVEHFAGKGKIALYIVPSLALMSQAVREWKFDAAEEFYAFSACSDAKVGNQIDGFEIKVSNLAHPSTTDAKVLAQQVKKYRQSKSKKMIVIFSTYQSINVISEAQKKHKLDKFDIIICDEAHRTTGVTFESKNESNFVKIHNNKSVNGSKRLYMTATPRIYTENAKVQAGVSNAVLASMDDEEIYGKELYKQNFAWAVDRNQLTDYKVIVLAVEEQKISDQVKNNLAKTDEVNIDDACKMIGCYKALAKEGFEKDPYEKNPNIPMKRALAFCRNISVSQSFEANFAKVVEDYNNKFRDNSQKEVKVEFSHVDGRFNAFRRTKALDWLKTGSSKDTCRVITNVRCLSEGVDVPTLDSIIFFHPRKSKIDIVQSVGRVMRKAKGKDIGYIILPVAVAPNKDPETVLENNEKFKFIWEVLNALRSHDIDLDDEINTILETNHEPFDPENPRKGPKITVYDYTQNEDNVNVAHQIFQPNLFTDLSQAIKAKILEKCGNRDYWKSWSKDIAKICEHHIIRIKSIVKEKTNIEGKLFTNFLETMRNNLNPNISENEAIEMLAQHIVTRPVFDSLFKDYEFTSNNVVSISMERLLSNIYNYKIETESVNLKKFYLDVERKAKRIKSSKGRQELITNLYDDFFKNAFPIMTEKFGIVYTPIEIVDFIINSVEYILKNEFNSSFNDSGVHVLDPFTGTGTFITRLLQLDLLNNSKILNKYKSEIHANEVVLLAYYIACINIESVFVEISGSNEYVPFEGMVLTDTFQLFESKRDIIEETYFDNSKRIKSQNRKNIRIIIGNPPYSKKQSSAHDNAANLVYLNLNKAIADTYAKESKSKSLTTLFANHIRAIKWSSDRVGDEGIIAFVTNASWIEGKALDGFRKCIHKEFSSIYVLNLKGDQRSSGEVSDKEGGKIFESKSRLPICIIILVKNKNKSTNNKIYYYDIGEYLSREEKLNIINEHGSIKKLLDSNIFKSIIPNKYGDWLDPRSDEFKDFLLCYEKSGNNKEILFTDCSNGLVTSRDKWVYNFSKIKLIENINTSIDFYNIEINKLSENEHIDKVKEKVSKNPSKIKWSRALYNKAKNKTPLVYNKSHIRKVLYRPFQKMFCYMDSGLIESPSRNKSLFPNYNSENLIIVFGSNKGEFSCLMSDLIPDFQVIKNCNYLPLFIYKSNNHDLIDESDNNFRKVNIKDNNQMYGIGEFGFNKFQSKYENEIKYQDIFYYIYALFHSEQYKSKFGNNLDKEEPRIPITDSFHKFKLFVEAGKCLADLHINYEEQKEYDLRVLSINNCDLITCQKKELFAVDKEMTFIKNNKSNVKYNKNIIIKDVPINAYDYTINRKPALKWVMERYCKSKDEKSGLTSDANLYSNETKHDTLYPLKLFKKIITVSLNTQKIVKSLPELEL